MAKVRRNQLVFRKSRRPLKYIVIILVCAALIFVGYSLAGPVMRFFSSLTGQSSSGASSSDPPSSAASSEAPSSSEISSAPSEIDRDHMQALWVPVDQLQGDKLDGLLSLLGEADLNAVVVDIKQADGALTYASQLEAPQKAGAVQSSAPDLKAALSRLKQAGITPVARMYCFQDPLAKEAVREGAVLYKPDPQKVWLDASASQGGKSWLNPYSMVAWEYLRDIALEAVDMGFENVMLDAVQLPNHTGAYAYFGPDADQKPAHQALTEFVSYMADAVQKKNARVILSSGGAAAAGVTQEEIYSGTNPLRFGAAVNAVDLQPASLPKQLNIGGTPLQPLSDVYETLYQLGNAVNRQNTDGSVLMPWVQAYDLPAGSIAKQISALNALGIHDMILYHPKGQYSASDIRPE